MCVFFNFHTSTLHSSLLSEAMSSSNSTIHKKTKCSGRGMAYLAQQPESYGYLCILWYFFGVCILRYMRILKPQAPGQCPLVSKSQEGSDCW